MRSWVGQVVVAVVLAAAGLILWRAGELEHRVAAAERELVTLRYDKAGEIAAEPVSRIARLMPGEEQTIADAKVLGANSEYWQMDYTTVAAKTDVKLLAANAAYHAARRDGGPWQAVVGRLDTLAKNYAEVLREEPNRTDAAFNYEYIVRLRSAIAARRQPVAAVDPSQTQVTIHGHEGAPPAESDTKKFKMIVPMRPDERLEAEKAGKGATKVRKG
jgi:hypothetical protein